MIRKALFAGSALVCLSGCEIPVMVAANANQGQMTGMFEVTFPAVLLVQVEDGSEEFLTGEMRGKAAGTAEFDLAGPTYGACSGTMNRSGLMNMTCANGVSISAQTESSGPQMSGIKVIQGTAMEFGFVSAFGWGNMATETAVRTAIAAET